MEDEDRSLLDRQPAEGAVELIADLDGQDVVIGLGRSWAGAGRLQTTGVAAVPPRSTPGRECDGARARTDRARAGVEGHARQPRRRSGRPRPRDRRRAGSGTRSPCIDRRPRVPGRRRPRRRHVARGSPALAAPVTPSLDRLGMSRSDKRAFDRSEWFNPAPDGHLSSRGDVPGPGRPIDDHDQPRRPVPRLPARRADRSAGRTTASSPATRASSPATSCGSTAAGRSLLNSAPIQFFSARFEYTNERVPRRRRPVDRQTLWRPRSTGRSSGGVHEDLDIVNYAPPAGPADDRDRDRVRLRRHLRRPGRTRSSAAAQINTRWFRSRRELRTTYDERRASGASWSSRSRRPTRRPSSPTAGSCSSPGSPPKGVWHTCLRWLPLTSSTRAGPTTLACNAVDAPSGRASPAAAEGRASRRRTDTVRRAWEQADPRHGRAPARGPDVRARASSSRPPACRGS